MQELVFETPDKARPSKAAARAARRAEKKKGSGHNTFAPPLLPKTDKQREYFEALWEQESIFAVGPAGSGKTYGPARIAARALLEHKIEKIIIARVTASVKKHALGFLPGKLGDKMKPWLIPILDALKAEVGSSVLEQWTQDGRLEIVSFEHMRGRTFEKAFIIFDEAQNANIADLKMFLTRIGEESQVVITGDLEQVDIRDSGLQTIIDLNRIHHGPMRLIEFSDADVVRSAFTREWVRIFRLESRAPDENLDETPAFLHNPGMSRNPG